MCAGHKYQGLEREGRGLIAISLLFHENPASRTIFHHFPETPFFVSKIHKLKRPIAAKAKKVTSRLTLSIDILNLGVFLRPLQNLLMPQYVDETRGKAEERKR